MRVWLGGSGYWRDGNGEGGEDEVGERDVLDSDLRKTAGRRDVGMEWSDVA